MAAPRPVRPATVRANAARLRDDAARYSRAPSSGDKADFLAAGRNALRHVLALLGGEGEVRVNRGGPAVSGEATLRTDSVYVCLSVSPFGDASDFYYRPVRGRKDYPGGGNVWHSYPAFAADPGGLVAELRRLAPVPGTVAALLRDTDYLALTVAAQTGGEAAGCAALDYAEEYLAADEWERFRGPARHSLNAADPP